MPHRIGVNRKKSLQSSLNSSSTYTAYTKRWKAHRSGTVVDRGRAATALRSSSLGKGRALLLCTLLLQRNEQKTLHIYTKAMLDAWRSSANAAFTTALVFGIEAEGVTGRCSIIPRTLVSLFLFLFVVLVLERGAILTYMCR